MNKLKAASAVLVAIVFLIAVSEAKRFIVTRWYEDEMSGTPFDDCGSVPGTLASVEVVGCSDVDTCTLKTGTSATIKINFAPTVATTSLKAVVHGIVGGVHVPFHIPQGDGCKKSGVQCPIAAGTQLNYATQIPVLKTYPKINLKVQWELIDDKGKDLICIIIPARIR